MANLLSNTTIGGYQSIHTGNIGSYALTSLPSHNHDDRYYTESESDSRFIRKNTWEGNAYIGTGGDIYGTIFYDSNDTAYYIDPSSYASRLKGLAVGESYYSHSYPGVVQSGSTNYNYNWYNGSWSGSVTLGYLANCSDQWEFGIHDSGQRVVSAFLFDGGGNNKIVMGRDLGWGATYIEAASSFRAPIFYDSADTTYYFDGNSTTSLRTRGSWRSDSSDWDGEYAGKIQYHSNHWYFQSGNMWYFRNAGGANVFQVDQSGNGTFNGDIYLGTRGTWLSSYLNQDVRTSASPSFASIYLNGTQLTGTQTQQLKNTLDVTTLPYKVDITVNGDANTFYAVQFWGGDQDVWRRIIIKRGYGETAPWDPIGTGVHHGGLLLDWEGNFGGWGGAEYADRIRVFNESYTNVCADMFIWSHSMGYVFMLRGGGAIYHLFSDQPINGFYQSGAPDILYSTSTLSYDDTWSGTNQYDVPAPAPLSLAQVNSSRIDGLRTKKQSLLDNRYLRQGIDISGIGNITTTNSYATNFIASNAFYLNGTSYYLNSANGGIYTNARFETAGNLVVQGNSYLGNGNGDEVHINDILRVGATDSGDAHFYFGEGSQAGSDYGAHFYWDSGYRFTWYTRNAGTDSTLFYYDTNSLSYITWGRSLSMNTNSIDYTGQLHFSGGTRFQSIDTHYLKFRTDATDYGSIQVRDGNESLKGHLGYFDANGFGLLNSSGSWGIRLNPGNGDTILYSGGNWKLTTTSAGISVNGNVYIDQNYGHGIVGLYASDRYQGVFAMGDSYKLSADGTSPGSLYGIAWTHTNVGGESKSGLGHQALFMTNGVTQTAIGTGIWTNGLITTTSYGTSANWNTAYSWGNHASAGYLTSGSLSGYATQSYVNSQGFLTSVPAQSQLISPNGATVVAADAAMPNAGHSFIHSLALGPGGNDGHILGMTWAGTTSIYGAQIFIDTDPNDIMAIRSRSSGGVWTSWKTVYHTGNFTNNSSNWDTAYSWGNHASAGYVTSSALSSYVPLSGATLTEGNYFYFRSNRGSYLGALDSPSLQVYASGGNAAFMSFHRGGNYAVNFGLDSDNVMRIGGWSAAADRWVLDMSGNNTVAGSFRAPIFYDSQNTNYYVDPASSSNLYDVYGYAYRGNGNVGGTGTASWHPDGAYIGSTMWQYGAQYKNNTGIYGVSEIQLNAGLYLQTYNDRNLIVKGNSSSDAGIEGRNAAGNNVFQIYGSGSDYGFLNGTWAAWDIRKTKNGALYMNDTSGYYLYTNGTSNFYALNIQGSAVIHAGNIGSQSVSYASSAGSAGSVTGLTLTSSANGINPDSVTQNQIGYNTSVSLFGQTDGGLYSSAYSSAWIHQIYGDFRTGQIAIRGKNSGSWQAWRTVLDSSNYTSYAPSLTGSGASGTWGINVTGSAGSVAWTNVSSRPTALSQFTNDLGNYGGFLTSITAHTHAISDISGLQTALDGKQAAGSYAASSHTHDDRYYTESESDTRFARRDADSAISGNLVIGNGTYGSSTAYGNSGARLMFSGSDGDAQGNYYIGTNHENYGGNYSKLELRWHTGIRMGAQPGYGGIRFYDTEDLGTVIFSVGSGDNHVRVLNNLYVGGNLALHAGNYNSYSPTLTGGNASGTWGINVTGSAGSVAWTNVSSRPTALSQFSNDLGNYGGWLTTGGKAADSELLDGIDSAYFVRGTGVNTLGYRTTHLGNGNSTQGLSSGFYDGTMSNMPSSDWYHLIVNAHYNSATNNQYEFHLATPFWDKSNFYVRSISPGDVGPWRTLIHNGNIGSQSVSYASTAGSATSAGTATSAIRLTRNGYITGEDWNGYYINNNLIGASVAAHSGPNRPLTSYNYGGMLSWFNSGEDCWQMYFPENSDGGSAAWKKLHYRTGWNGTWGPWRIVVDMVGNVSTIAGSNESGLEIHSNVGYNQDPLTYLLLRGQADNSWKSFKVRLTGDAGGQDIEFRRIAQNGADARMFYVPRGANQVIFEYQFVQGSDSRLKDNIIPITNSLDKIKSLRGVEFDWNSGVNEGTHDVGLIAQDVEAVLPEAVTTQEDGYKNLAYTKVIPLMVEAMKEQQAMIDALKAEIELLKNK